MVKSGKYVTKDVLLRKFVFLFIFLLALAVEGSALGLTFSFSFWLLFHDARKNLCFQTNHLISENKVWWGNRENMQDLFQRISGSDK